MRNRHEIRAMLHPRRTFGTPDPQTRRLILDAAKTESYRPGMAQEGRAAMRRYLVEYCCLPAAEFDRIMAAADRLVASKAELPPHALEAEEEEAIPWM